MKYKITFELPDNDTVIKDIKTARVQWSVWGYSGTAHAEPERKTGQWILHLGFSCPWECSECSIFQRDVSWYCPNCGAKIEVQND